MQQLTDKLKLEAKSLGFVMAGVTAAAAPGRLKKFHDWLDSGMHGSMHYLETRRDAYAHPHHVLNGCSTIVMLGLPYTSGETLGESQAESLSQGRIARYAQSANDYHDVIHARLKKLKAWVLSNSPSANVRGVIDTAPLLEREFAEQAGLGWIGKNTLLLSRHHGSYFFLAALLTDLPLSLDSSNTKSHCGTCTACLDSCPTKAFPEPYVLDATKCISFLTIEHRDAIEEPTRQELSGWMFGCDVCQEVCPWNRFAGAPDSELEPVTATLDIVSTLQLTDEEFRKLYRKSAFWRPRRRGLIRNAILLAGTQQLEEAIPALQKLTQDTEEVLSDAAEWALARIAERGQEDMQM